MSSDSGPADGLTVTSGLIATPPVSTSDREPVKGPAWTVDANIRQITIGAIGVKRSGFDIG